MKDFKENQIVGFTFTPDSTSGNMIVRGNLINWKDHPTDYWYEIHITHVNGSRMNPQHKNIIGKTFRWDGPIMRVVQ